MSEHGQDASLFSHRLLVATPEGFGPETGVAIDRYVLSQIGRRWRGAFARIEGGVYLFRVDAETEAELNSLVLLLSIALFGRISTPGCALAAHEQGGDLAAPEPITLDAAATERMTKTLAAFENGAAEPAAVGDGAAISSLEAAVRETKEGLDALRGEVGAVAEKVGSSADASAPAEIDAEEKPMFKMARGGAVLFAASMKSMSRKVDTAVASLVDAVKRIEDAAPGAPIEAEAAEDGSRSGPSEETLRSLAENLAELARGQALIATSLQADGGQEDVTAEDGAAEDAVAEDQDADDAGDDAEEAGPDAAADDISDQVAALGEKIEGAESAIGGLASRIAEVGEQTAGDLAVVLDEMNTIADDCRTALEQMLDVAIAWRRSIEAEREAGAPEAELEASEVADAEVADAEVDASEVDADAADEDEASEAAAEDAEETDVAEAAEDDVAGESAEAEAEAEADDADADADVDVDVDLDAEDADAFGEALADAGAAEQEKSA